MMILIVRRAKQGEKVYTYSFYGFQILVALHAEMTLFILRLQIYEYLSLNYSVIKDNRSYHVPHFPLSYLSLVDFEPLKFCACSQKPIQVNSELVSLPPPLASS